MTFIVFMIGSGVSIELLRRYLLRKRHGMTLGDYNRRRARGEDVPRL